MSACGSAGICRSTMTGLAPLRAMGMHCTREAARAWHSDDLCASMTSTRSLQQSLLLAGHFHGKESPHHCYRMQFRSLESSRWPSSPGGRAEQGGSWLIPGSSSRRGYHELTCALRGREHWRTSGSHDRISAAGERGPGLNIGAGAGGHCPTRLGGGTIYRLAVSRRGDALPPRP